ncbi:MAG TPA: DUF1573 domain-containing protein [Tepidisphaeraceae bacterium]|nr:DUF1573 domain-containing protein [Tepidisphaeraceae bacterium]
MAVAALAVVMMVMLRTRRASASPFLPPGLRLESDTQDLGIISAASSATGRFKISNTGPLVYRIDKVIPECGCMAAHLPDPVLGYPRTIDLAVTVNGAGWGDGLRKKSVAVFLSDNHGVRSSLKLTVTASVRRVTNLEVAPGRIDVPFSRTGEPIVVSLFVRGDKAIVDLIPPKILVTDAPITRLGISPSTLEGRSASREVFASIESPPAGQEADQRTLEIAVSGSYRQVIQIPIRLHSGH